MESKQWFVITFRDLGGIEFGTKRVEGDCSVHRFRPCLIYEVVQQHIYIYSN